MEFSKNNIYWELYWTSWWQLTIKCHYEPSDCDGWVRLFPLSDRLWLTTFMPCKKALLSTPSISLRLFFWLWHRPGAKTPMPTCTLWGVRERWSSRVRFTKISSLFSLCCGINCSLYHLGAHNQRYHLGAPVCGGGGIATHPWQWSHWCPWQQSLQRQQWQPRNCP